MQTIANRKRKVGEIEPPSRLKGPNGKLRSRSSVGEDRAMLALVLVVPSAGTSNVSLENGDNPADLLAGSRLIC